MHVQSESNQLSKMKSFIFVLCTIFFLAPGLQGSPLSKLNVAEIKNQLINGQLTSNQVLKMASGDWTTLKNELFDAAAREFGLIFDATQRQEKQKKFDKNLEEIQKLTSESDGSVQFGITSLSFISFEDYKKTMLMPLTKDINFVTDSATFSSANRTALYSGSVDLRQRGAVNPIRDQGQCGSCYAFSTAAVMETAYFNKHKSLPDLSEQQIVDCTCQGCGGGNAPTVFNFAQQNNLLEEKQDPYHASSGSSCNVPNNIQYRVATWTGIRSKAVEAMMDTLDQGYAISVAFFSSTQQFMHYRGGVMHYNTQCQPRETDHLVTIVGYDHTTSSPYWIVRNSWGQNWGESGYFRAAIGTDYCNIEDYAFYASMD